MPHAVLTEDLVRQIRAMQRPGVGARKIMQSLGITDVKEATVAAVLSGKTWRHVH